jgi:hypothetical protein
MKKYQNRTALAAWALSPLGKECLDLREGTNVPYHLSLEERNSEDRTASGRVARKDALHTSVPINVTRTVAK